MKIEAFEAFFGKKVSTILQHEANRRTNELKPVGVSAWNEQYKKLLVELQHDYLWGTVVNNAVALNGNFDGSNQNSADNTMN